MFIFSCILFLVIYHLSRYFLLQITTDFQVLRMDLNSSRNNLEDADAELQKSLTAQNESLTTRVSINSLFDIYEETV